MVYGMWITKIYIYFKPRENALMRRHMIIGLAYPLLSLLVFVLLLFLCFAR